VVILELIHVNILKDMQAHGRTYVTRNIFEVMPDRGRRIYLPRKFFRVSPVRCSGTKLRLPRIIFSVAG
jgi:hypothetical protein